MYQAKRPDYKEFFSIGLELPEDDPDVLADRRYADPNNWPEFMPELRPALYGYYEAVGACGADLLRAVAVSLGVDEHFFAPRYTKRMQRTQMVYYPPQPPQSDEDQFGVAPHTDYGCITLLWQDQVGGLQVREIANDTWIDAPPVEGSFVVNVGDLLARWTDDRFRSTLHRVINASGVSVIRSRRSTIRPTAQSSIRAIWARARTIRSISRWPRATIFSGASTIQWAIGRSTLLKRHKQTGNRRNTCMTDNSNANPPLSTAALTAPLATTLDALRAALGDEAVRAGDQIGERALTDWTRPRSDPACRVAAAAQHRGRLASRSPFAMPPVNQWCRRAV